MHLRLPKNLPPIHSVHQYAYANLTPVFHLAIHASLLMKMPHFFTDYTCLFKHLFTNCPSIHHQRFYLFETGAFICDGVVKDFFREGNEINILCHEVCFAV